MKILFKSYLLFIENTNLFQSKNVILIIYEYFLGKKYVTIIFNFQEFI